MLVESIPMSSTSDRQYQGFGGAVRQFRQARGWTQDDLGEAAGLTQKYISQIERQRDPGYLPPMATVHALARALGCTSTELVRASGYIEESESELPAELKDHRVRLFASKLDAFTDEEINAIMAWVRSKESSE